MVNGEIHVVSGFRLNIIPHLHNASHIILVKQLMPLASLQDRLHLLLDSGFPHNIRQGVILILLHQLIVFLLGDLAGVADQMGKIYAVRIAADGILGNLHTLQMVGILLDGSHGFLADICGNGSLDIFLEGILPQGIPDRQDLVGILHGKKELPVFFIVLGGGIHALQADPELIVAAQVFKYLLGGGLCLRISQLVGVFRHVLNLAVAIDIRQEALQVRPLHIEGKCSVSSHLQGKAVIQLVPVPLQNGQDLINLRIQLRILALVIGIMAAVLQGHGIGQLIVGQRNPVAVIDNPSGSVGGALLLQHQGIFVRIFLAIDNLQGKHPLQKNAEQKDHKQCKHKQPGCYNSFGDIFD